VKRKGKDRRRIANVQIAASGEVFKVFTGNGDEKEEYPRIHESAGRGAAAAAGWEGSPVHHAARRIALDTREDNAPTPPFASEENTARRTHDPRPNTRNH